MIDAEAVDRIIHAVQHWADDIEDPVQRALHVELDAAVDAVLRAYAEKNGLKFPQDVPDGKARFSIKIGDEKFKWDSVW